MSMEALDRLALGLIAGFVLLVIGLIWYALRKIMMSMHRNENGILTERVGIALSASMLQRIRRLAKAGGRKYSDQTRLLISKGLDQLDAQGPVDLISLAKRVARLERQLDGHRSKQ